ncbi:hypothetical protein FEE95_01965 [Maribacter algarum]|uniref:Glycosyltransferase RgtA/B/C/D-like domain-containing protein n=1 Tax=Maribacter algarum (ex Zhang et al. 2020) TaxID=2578118 RepID=A0A5S3PT94_9FLAO|nr:hypothetical protein [Maribacter algarum]TMM58216.1 hypothetical protein FEE95_01965 [Maribacter algarum]
MKLAKKIGLKHLIPFLPLLALYVVLILVFSPDQLVGDEGRYMYYANNIIEGFYADTSDPWIRNGPGYPLAITLPVLLKTPFLLIRLLNVVFLAMALLLFYQLLAMFIKTPRIVIAICYLLGLYPPLARSVTGILSESFSIFLMCGFLFFFVKLCTHQFKQGRNLFLSGLFLGVLALTKVIFGYVILLGILGCLVTFIFNTSKKIKLSLFTFILSFLFCIPYLAYTQHVTGKKFLWGTHSGEMLYWRSTPFENEYGDWVSADIITGKSESNYIDTESLVANHGEFIKSLEPYSAIERDSIYKEKAIENIKNHPTKFAKNTVASGFRLFYNYPYTHMPLKVSTYFYLLPNTFLIVFLLITSFLVFTNIKVVPFEIYILGFLSIVLMGGLTLLDGRVRHLLPIIPILIFLIAYTLNRFLQVKIINREA